MNLTISQVSKIYPGGIQALDNVSMEINRGMFGLMGPNGAGKSTLMRIIATLQEPNSGSVLFDGVSVLKDRNLIRRRLGYLPQDFGLYPDMTAERMLNHIALLKGMADGKERRAAVRATLERANLLDVRRRRLGSFSGGMKQRFGIAQALVADPDLLIVDEPTAGLDPEERNRFLNILSEISEKKIVILSTHIVDDIRVLCPQMSIIHQGRILLSGQTDDCLAMLENRLWKKTIDREDMGRYDSRFDIIFTRMASGQMEIHVYSVDRPAEGFEPLAPELEDVYFWTLKKDKAAGN
jgi:ABC-2 type transport system ATP-binding protein